MSFVIAGYTYIQHRLVNRPWGPECQFTMADAAGRHINDVVPIPSMDATNAVLKGLVEDYLTRKKAREDHEALFDRFFDDAGREVLEALHWLVRKIRANPAATLGQA